MPATPARKLILDAMVSAFEGMKAPTYFTTVRTVSRTVEFMGCPHPDQCPMVLCFPDSTTSKQVDGQRVVHSRMRVFVIGYVAGANQDERDDRIAELEDDLLRLVMGTQRWGGASYMTTVETVETSEADSDDNPIGWVGMSVLIDYERELA